MAEETKPQPQKEEWVLVSATQIGWYDDQRRFPAGHGHPKSGFPFWVKRSQFSNCKKERGTGMMGWMQELDPKTLQPITGQELPTAGPAMPFVPGLKPVAFPTGAPVQPVMPSTAPPIPGSEKAPEGSPPPVPSASGEMQPPAGESPL